MSDPHETRSTLIAAAAIFIFAVGGWFVMPPLMRWLGETFSPYVAFAAAALFVGAFFAIFWLRGRYQRSRRR